MMLQQEDHRQGHVHHQNNPKKEGKVPFSFLMHHYIKNKFNGDEGQEPEGDEEGMQFYNPK
jgi:hypothetical protein